MSAQLDRPPTHATAGALLNHDPVNDTVPALLESLSELKEITYGLLKKVQSTLLTEELSAKGKSLQRVENCNTALNAWMKEFDLTDESPVGPEFAEGFNSHLDEHIRTLQGQGKAKQTIDDRRSFLGKYRETWVDLLQAQRIAAAAVDFAGALGAQIRACGVPVSHVAREVGVTVKAIRQWADGRCKPVKKSLPVIYRLEEFFSLPFGALAARLPRFIRGSGGRPKTGQTGYRRHLQTVNKSQYFLPELTPRLREEFGRLYRFHTDAAWLRVHGMKRNSKWREREQDGKCPTADRVSTQLRGFFGYLRLPPDKDTAASGGKGYPPEELTLALLSDSDLVYDFLQFKKERTYLKQYNNETRTFLALCLATLRPETGFLWQSPELGARLPVPVTPSEWGAWCERHRAVFKATQKDLLKEDEFKKTRDPFDAVRGIIVNNQHPLDVLHDLADDFEADQPAVNASPLAKAAHSQLLLLIRFATLLPLRAYNFSTMTYQTDNTGNLYRKPDGSWWVRIGTEELKNHRGAARNNPLDVPLNESLWPYIEEFLLVHRPHLAGAKECAYVFRRKTARKGVKIDDAVATEYLSKQVYLLTQRYIDDCPGFRLHAFRHLVATDYTKNNPGGYAVAAAVLHDKEETVRQYYAWVVPADKFLFWNQYVDAQRERRRREREEAAEGVL
jgi:hypothetical protein